MIFGWILEFNLAFSFILNQYLALNPLSLNLWRLILIKSHFSLNFCHNLGKDFACFISCSCNDELKCYYGRDLNSKISAMKIFERFLTILGFIKRYVVRWWLGRLKVNFIKLFDFTLNGAKILHNLSRNYCVYFLANNLIYKF